MGAGNMMAVGAVGLAVGGIAAYESNNWNDSRRFRGSGDGGKRARW